MTNPTSPADLVATARLSERPQSTEAEDNILLARASMGDRSAMGQLYIQYFTRLAKFFENVTLRAEHVEGLVNDTMSEVWKVGQPIRTSTSVLLSIMRLAYTHVQTYIAEARACEHPSQLEARGWEQSISGLATAKPSDDLHIFLSKLSVEARAALHLAYANRCSRRETADVMNIPCDNVDALLRGVRESAKLYYSATSPHAPGSDTR